MKKETELKHRKIPTREEMREMARKMRETYYYIKEKLYAENAALNLERR